jgi:hypothetical protein
MKNDLSHVYANDPDDGQEEHGNLPPEALHHFAAAFAHKAGVGPDPGVYKCPAVTPPADWETPADEFGQHSENQSQAIANTADFGNAPEIPASKAQKSAPAKSSPTGLPAAQPPFEELGQ